MSNSNAAIETLSTYILICPADLMPVWFDTSPVAQSVERLTPRDERTRPGKKGPGFEARRTLDVYEPPGGTVGGRP